MSAFNPFKKLNMISPTVALEDQADVTLTTDTTYPWITLNDTNKHGVFVVAASAVALDAGEDADFYLETHYGDTNDVVAIRRMDWANAGKGVSAYGYIVHLAMSLPSAPVLLSTTLSAADGSVDMPLGLQARLRVDMNGASPSITFKSYMAVLG